MCPELLPCLVGAYPTFMAGSNHSCLAVSLAPPLQAEVWPRDGVPTSFLKDEDVVSRLATCLLVQHETGLGWWEAAHEKVKAAARRYESSHRPQGFNEVAAHLHTCTSQCVSHEAMESLQSKGIMPTTAGVGNSALAALAERKHADRSGILILKSLKGLLWDEGSDKAKHKAQIARVFWEFHTRHRLSVLHRLGGSLLTEPLEIARSLGSYWSSVMADRAGYKVISCIIKSTLAMAGYSA